MGIAMRVGCGFEGRTTVVPTATTRPPRARVWLTTAAVVSGTSNHSGYGSSPDSSDETPVCRVNGAIEIPAVRSDVIEPR